METNKFPTALAAPRSRLAVICLFGALLLGLLGTAAAAPVDLYSAEAEVSGEGADERNRGIAEAFRAVLVKLTGDRMVGTRAGVDDLLAQAPGLVQQYRYRVAETDSEAGQAPQRYLWVRFDDAAVDRLLAERSWPVWRAPRPRLLVWLSTDEGGRRSLVSAETQPAAGAALRGRGEVRGIPVQMPLLDLEDQSRLTPADLWSGFEEPIRAASQRYGEGPVLVGRLKFLGKGRWQPEWLLLGAGDVQAYSGAPGDLAQVLGAGVDAAADRLTARFAPTIAATGPAPVRIDVNGVYGLADYAAVLEILGRAPGVNRLSLRGGFGDGLQFDVWLDGSPDTLVNDLGLEPRLRAMPAVTDTAVGTRRLSYQWLP